MTVKSFKNWNFCMVMHINKIDKVNTAFQKICDTTGRNYLNMRFLTCWQYRSLTWSHTCTYPEQPSKISQALGTTIYCKINPINIWQNSTITTSSLLIYVTLNHVICQKEKSCLRSNNMHFTSHHLKMVSCCVQFSTAIIITAKGFLSTLLRFCSHSCSMSLQDNLKLGGK